MDDEFQMDGADYALPRIALTGDDTERLWRRIRPRKRPARRWILAAAASLVLGTGLIVGFLRTGTESATFSVSCNFATGAKELTLTWIPDKADEAAWRQLCDASEPFTPAVLQELVVCEADPNSYIVRFGANAFC